MILVLDNRDSFTFNLLQAFQELGVAVQVRRADRESLESLLALEPRGIVIGPGPGRPETAELSLRLVAEGGELPILGVCLGHQAIASHFGARIQRSQHLRHGRTSRISHDGLGVFRGLPNPARFTRYNSLCVDPASLPDCLVPSAHCEDGELMGLRHRTRPLEGVQFHPESVLSEGGLELLGNFVAGLAAGPNAGVQRGQGPAAARRSSPS